MNIIPAIDIINGKCVRLTRGDYNSSKEYSEHPVAIAEHFQSLGCRYLHVVDLDGARLRQVVNAHIISDIARSTSLIIDVGGGIQTERDIEIMLKAGATQITCGSVAAKQPELFLQWLERYGSETLILGADAIDGCIAVQGWQETTKHDVVEFIATYQQKGVQHVICTDIAKDGMLQGPSVDLYRKILATTNVRLVASGGVTTIEDLRSLQQIGCSGAIIGKALYEGTIHPLELKDILHEGKLC